MCGEPLAEVQCILPGNSKCVAEVLLSPGWHSLPKIAQDLQLPLPLLGLVSLDGEAPESKCEAEETHVSLQVGQRYKTVLGAAPLIRFSVENKQSRPRLCEEGLWLLKNISAPVYVVAFVGMSRKGKSTTCSALASVAEGKDPIDGEVPTCFPSAAQNKPLTAGADVAAIPNSKDGGCLLIIDCEGCDNALSKNLQSSRILATIAFAFSSHIMYCIGDSFAESFIDDLGSVVATRELIQISHETSFLPKLCVLMMKHDIIAERDEVEEIFEEKDGCCRNESRRAIQEIYGGLPDVRNLVNFREQGNDVKYKEEIRRLHDDLCRNSASNASLHLKGVQLVDLLKELCQTVAKFGSFEPENACASFIRGHLQMIMKACIDAFADNLPSVERLQDHIMLQDKRNELVQKALMSFDDRTHKIGTKSQLLASAKTEMRLEMENELKSMYFHKVLIPNAQHKISDELIHLRSKARWMTTLSIALFVLLALAVFWAVLVLNGTSERDQLPSGNRKDAERNPFTVPVPQGSLETVESLPACQEEFEKYPFAGASSTDTTTMVASQIIQSSNSESIAEYSQTFLLEYEHTNTTEREEADTTADDGRSWFSDAWEEAWNSLASWKSFAVPREFVWPRRWTPSQASTPVLCGVAGIVVVAAGVDLAR